jgi:hypothetical protein
MKQIFEKARTSAWGLFLLNQAFFWKLPFNRPHGIRILSVDETGLTTVLPFRRNNLNHLGTMHACALATLAEFTAGTELWRRLEQKGFRLVLQSLHMTYIAKATEAVYARFGDEMGNDLTENLINQLQKNKKASFEATVVLLTKEGKELALGTSHWYMTIRA